jgi:hypothetical protein
MIFSFRPDKGFDAFAMQVNRFAWLQQLQAPC